MPLVPALAIARSSWPGLWPAAEALFLAHHAELSLPGAKPMALDLAGFDALDRAGALVVFTGTLGGALAGYIIWYLTPDLEHKGALLASQGPWYSTPEGRQHGLGLALFRASLAGLAPAHSALAHSWPRSPKGLEKFFTRLGGSLAETSYLIPLSKA